MEPSASQLVHRFVEALNGGDVDTQVQCLDHNFEGYDITLESSLTGLAEAQLGIRGLYRSFPTVKFTIHEILSRENGIGVFWSMEAEHLGVFRRIPATGLHVSTTGTSMLTIKDGVIQRGLHVWDLGALLRSMRLIPQHRTGGNTSGRDWLSGFFAA